MSRTDRLTQCTKSLPLVTNESLIKSMKLSKDEMRAVKLAVDSFITDTLSQYFERHFPLVEDVLDTYYQEILELPNVTPNGIFLPKSPTQLSFNVLHQAVATLVAPRVSPNHFSYVHAPITLRLVRDEQSEQVLKRPRASTKPHTDIWAAEPSASCMCFIPVAGDFKNNGVSFYNNETLPLKWREPLDDYHDGTDYVSQQKVLTDVAMNLGEIYFVDSHVIHKTEKNSSKLRATIDFRFLYTEWDVSDNAQRLHRMENYLPLQEWLAVGTDSMLKFNQPLAAFEENGPTTNGYSTPYEHHRLNCRECKQIDRYVLANWLGCELEFAEKAIQSCQFSALPAYQRITHAEQNQLLAKSEKQLNQQMRVCSPESKSVWEKGWGEVRDKMISSHSSSVDLKPQYSNYQYFRLFGEYVRSDDSMFEEHLYSLIRTILFYEYFHDASQIVEFGSGTGTSLLLLDASVENKDIHTCDWAEASNDICIKLAKKCRNNIQVHNVDLFTMKGAEPLRVLTNPLVFSFHTFEQLGRSFDVALEFILAMKPSRVVQLEPLDEVYSDEDIFDLVAREYHYKRNYLSGYITKLKQLEKGGYIVIEKIQRLAFGSMFHEGYNLLIWRVVD